MGSLLAVRPRPTTKGPRPGGRSAPLPFYRLVRETARLSSTDSSVMKATAAPRLQRALPVPARLPGHLSSARPRLRNGDALSRPAACVENPGVIAMRFASSDLVGTWFSGCVLDRCGPRPCNRACADRLRDSLRTVGPCRGGIHDRRERAELLAIRADLQDEEAEQHSDRGHASARILRAVARLDRLLDGASASDALSSAESAEKP